MKKVSILFLSLVLLAAVFSGCKKSAPAAAAGEGTAQSIIFFRATDRKVDENNAHIHARILEDINVDVKYLTTPDSEWQQKFALMVSSREKMDFMILTPLVYQQYAKQGGFKDIGTEYQKYPNLMQHTLPSAWDRVKVDGVRYGIPVLNTEGKYNIYMRGDWLEKLNLQVPKTLDDFYNVMTAFTRRDPDGNGANDTFGWSGANLQPFFGAFGVMGVNDNASQPAYYTLEGNQISANAISDNYRQALTFIKKLYDEKLMDPETFIQTAEQLAQKYTNSKIGAYTAWWNSAGSTLYRNYDFENINPNANIIMPDPPAGPAGKQGFAAQDPVQNVIAVNRDITPEALEAGLKFLDYNLSDNGWRTTAWGVEGLHWSTDDAGKVNHIAVLNRNDLTGKTVVPENMEFYSVLIRWDIYPQRYFLSDMVSVKNKEALERSTQVPLIRNAFVGISTDEGIRYIPDLAKYELESQLKFILGQEPLSNWNNYVNQWKALGGEEVRQSFLKAYNAQNGTNYTFLEP